ncbi:MAG: hypothetical protein AAF960_06285 [Bacteroidota bacterium]
MATKTAKKTARKSTAKKVTPTNENIVDFSKSVETIKGSAKTVNNEVLNTATEVLEDLRNNGAKIREAATARVNEALEAVKLEEGVKYLKEMFENASIENGVKFVKETVENVSVENGVKFVRETAKNINTYSLETMETVVDGTLKGGKEWQGVAEKAVKGGLELAEKQQEIMFDTLEAVKGQFAQGAKRFRGLFQNK